MPQSVACDPGVPVSHRNHPALGLYDVSIQERPKAAQVFPAQSAGHLPSRLLVEVQDYGAMLVMLFLTVLVQQVEHAGRQATLLAANPGMAGHAIEDWTSASGAGAGTGSGVVYPPAQSGIG